MTSAPAYCLHRRSGQAYVILSRNGGRRFRYLGKWGTESSLSHYASALSGAGYPADAVSGAVAFARRTVGSPRARPTPTEPHAPTVRDLYAAFMRWAEGHYRLPTGGRSREVQNFEHSFRDCLTAIGDRPCASVTKRDLAGVRDAMVGRGLSRKVINQRVSRLLHVFRWGTEEDRGLVPELTAAALHLLKPLAAFRTPAAERDPVPGVPLQNVRKVIAAVNPVVGAMLDLQLLTGMRLGEVRGLRKRMVVRCEGQLLADFGKEHKMAYRRQTRVVPLGPQAMRLLRPWLSGCADGDAIVFRPRLAPKSRTRSPNFTHTSYGHAVSVGCRRAGVPHFAPNQIRHAVAEEVRRTHGLEYVQSLLGHKNRQSSERYAPVVSDLAAEVARRRG